MPKEVNLIFSDTLVSITDLSRKSKANNPYKFKIEGFSKFSNSTSISYTDESVNMLNFNQD